MFLWKNMWIIVIHPLYVRSNEDYCNKYWLKLLVMRTYKNVLGENFGFWHYYILIKNPWIKLTWEHYCCTSEVNITGGLNKSATEELHLDSSFQGKAEVRRRKWILTPSLSICSFCYIMFIHNICKKNEEAFVCIVLSSVQCKNWVSLQIMLVKKVVYRLNLFNSNKDREKPILWHFQNNIIIKCVLNYLNFICRQML